MYTIRSKNEGDKFMKRFGHYFINRDGGGV
jgi:hypothetical protein